MGGSAIGGLWRHQQLSQSWILPKIQNQVKTARNRIFFVIEMKNNTQISTLHDFSHMIYFYYWKKLNKKHVFSLQKGLDTCYLWRHIS